MQTILVTGGSGFIGTHVRDNLLARGKDVIILDRRPHHYPGVFLADVKDHEAVGQAVSLCDGVIHLAGKLGTQETIDEPMGAVEVNIHGSLNVFDACRIYHKKAVYIGVGNYWMRNPYSITKTAAEKFAYMYNKEHGTQIAMVRGLNAYGPRQLAEPVRKVVPNFVLSALRGEDLIIYGSGDQIMDMIYVTDIAEILVRALLMEHGIYHRAIEAGMGRDTTINELAQLIIAACGSHSRIKHVEMRPGEEPNSVVKADVRTLECLGYSVNDMTSLEAGIAKTTEWHRARL